MCQATRICALIAFVFSFDSTLCSAAPQHKDYISSLSALVSKIPGYLWQATYAPVAQGFKADCRDLTDSTATLPSRIKGALHLLSSIIAHVPFEGIFRACCLNETFLKKYAGITELETLSKSDDPDLKEIANTMNVDSNKIWLAKIPKSTETLPGFKTSFCAQTWNKYIICLASRNLEEIRKYDAMIENNKKLGFDSTNLAKDRTAMNNCDRSTMAHEIAHTKRNSTILSMCYCLSSPAMSTICLRAIDELTQKALSLNTLANKPIIRTLSSIAHTIATSSITQFVLQQYIQRSLQKHDEMETDIRGATDSNQVEIFIEIHKGCAQFAQQKWQKASLWEKLKICTNRFFETHPTNDRIAQRLQQLRT